MTFRARISRVVVACVVLGFFFPITGEFQLAVAAPPPAAAHPDNHYWIKNAAAPSLSWTAIASSADGSRLVAVSDNGVIYTSDDYGVSWGNQSPTTFPSGNYFVTSSSDGSHLAIAVPGQGIWTSVNYGVNWIQPDLNLNGLLSGTIDALASSADGSRLVASVDGGYLFISRDFGTTWHSLYTDTSNNWKSLVINSDGSQISAGDRLGSVWTTTDSGATWFSGSLPGGGIVQTLASSSDGSFLIAGAPDRYTATSIDSGTTWVQQGIVSNVSALTASTDGSHITAIAQGALWSSTDFGVTWIRQASSNNNFMANEFDRLWTHLAANADGSSLFVTSSNGDTWTGPSTSYDATLRQALIRDTSTTDLGSPSQNLSTVTSGSITLTQLASSVSSLPTVFTPTYEGSVVSRIVQYPSGADTSHFQTDEIFTNQSISSGDFIAVEVTSQANTHLYYKFDIALAPTNVLPDLNVAPDFRINNPTFGPTVIGQTETQTIQLAISSLRCEFGCDIMSLGDVTYSSGNFSIDVSGCMNLEPISTTTCNIVIAFTPSSTGDYYGIIRLKYVWNEDVPTKRFPGSQDEFVIIKGTGIPAPTPPNPPLVWQSHEVKVGQGWKGIASSTDGTHLAAIINGGDIFTSSDGGNSWIDRTTSGARGWYSISSNSDGSLLFAVDNDNYFPRENGSGGFIYRSSDFGATWETVTVAGQHIWTSISVSPDGLNVIASAYRNHIYTSNDGGITWYDRGSPDDTPNGQGVSAFPSAAQSFDGIHIIALENGDADGGNIFASGDGGRSWSGTESPYTNWQSVTSNSDGSRLAAIAYQRNTSFGDIYTSSDFGLTWTDKTSAIGPLAWSSIASSFDGAHLATTANGDYIYTSEDFGVTWESQTVAGQNTWTSIAMSGDGQLLAAVGTNSDIWTLRSNYVSSTSSTSAYAPSPLQMSKIDSLFPNSGELEKATSAVISGKFVETVLRIVVNGVGLPSESWKQTSTAISFLMPSLKAGTYSIELFNGSVPLLPTQSFEVKEVQASRPVVDTATNTAPAPQISKPRDDQTSDRRGTRPLSKSLLINVYFDMASYVINSKNFIKLAALAKRISGLGSNITIAITGYAQPTPGSEATDGLLSKRRAAAVAKIMRSFGVNTKIIYKGAGRAAVNDPSSRYVQIVAANS